MKKIALSLIFIFMVLFISGCDKEIYELNTDINTDGKNPVLISINPPDSTLAGIGTMTLIGENFIPKIPYGAFNQVYFNEVSAVILDATETQLTIRTPALIGDSIHIKISTSEAEQIVDSVFYDLKFAVKEYGSFLEDDIGYGLAVDSEENLFVSVKGGALSLIKKVAPDGATSELKSTSFAFSNVMRMGPDNTVYASFAAGRARGIKKILESGDEENFVSLSAPPNSMDFDENQNIWVARRVTTASVIPSQIERVGLDGGQQEFEQYDYNLTAVRVFEGYLYFAGKKEETEHKIWRRQINGDGTLGADELVLDEATFPVLLELTVNAITFTQSGLMFLATDHSPDALYTYDMSTGTLEVFYPDLIGPEIVSMTYGNGAYLYVSRQEAGGAFQLLIINTQMQGAPYYGRQ